MDKTNLVIVIGGPTASGKSQLAMDVALSLGGAVVNADAMQMYKNTPIISACPTAEDKAMVEHCLYEVWDASQNGSVVEWLELANAEIRRLWAEGKVPVVVGGTGMYIDNLINGVTPIPETAAEVKRKVQQMLAEQGVNALHNLLAELDPLTAQRLSPNDTTRVRRALEVFYDTGKPLSEWYQIPMVKKLPEARFEVIRIIPHKDELDERCFIRFDKMMQQGALAEVEALAKRNLSPKLPAMRALGVPELLEYVAGKISLDEAVALGKLHTRQYAKRQRTWFNNKLNQGQVLPCCYNKNNLVVKNLLNCVNKGVKK